MTRRWVYLAVVVCSLTRAMGVASAQQTPSPNDLASILSAETNAPPADIRYNNRLITTLRATVLSRTPQQRADAVAGVLTQMQDAAPPPRVSVRYVQGVALIAIGDRDIIGIVPTDVDPRSGETLTGAADTAVERLRQALGEAAEIRTPSRLLAAAARAALGTVLLVLTLMALSRARLALNARLVVFAERRIKRLSAGQAEIVTASHAVNLLTGLVTAGTVVIEGLVAYRWLTFVLRSFPYTRPWGESLRSLLWTGVSSFSLQVIQVLPNLFTAAVILVITRFVVRASNLVFDAVAQRRLNIPAIYPETALPTRRIVAVLLWLVGFVVAYPYLPGSDSEAFKGVSVFIGLMISLGSSSVVNQMMSGLTITYSRAVRVGDFVRVGSIEGTVTMVGVLSTKLKSPRGEEITIPNAVVVADVTTNYSRFNSDEGVFVPVTLTIGYDTPWRQVEALLLLAAERTPGIRARPAPLVYQTALQDFYVQYTLLVSLEHPHRRGATVNALHANVQDAFNEFDVQIMSPNYEADPDDRKTVPRSRWYAAPARREVPLARTGSRDGT